MWPISARWPSARILGETSAARAFEGIRRATGQTCCRGTPPTAVSCCTRARDARRRHRCGLIDASSPGTARHGSGFQPTAALGRGLAGAAPAAANSFPRRGEHLAGISVIIPTCAWWRGTGLWRCSTTPRHGLRGSPDRRPDPLERQTQRMQPGRWRPRGPRLAHMRAGAHLFQRVRPDGSVIARCTAKPLPGGGFVTTASDVTAYKRAEHALIDRQPSCWSACASAPAELSAALRRRSRPSAGRGGNHSKSLPRCGQPRPAATARCRAPVHLGAAPPAAARQQIGPADRAHRHLVPVPRRGPAQSLLEASRWRPAATVPGGRRHARGPHQAAAAAVLRAGGAARSEARGRAERSGGEERRSSVAAHRANFVSMRCATRAADAYCWACAGAAAWRASRYGTAAPASRQGTVAAHLRRSSSPGQPSPWGEKGLGLGLAAICERMAHPRPSAHGAFWRSPAAAFAVRPVPIVARVLRGAPHAPWPRRRWVCWDGPARAVPGQQTGHPRRHVSPCSRWGITCDLAPDAREALAACAGGADLIGRLPPRRRARRPDVRWATCAPPARTPTPPAVLITADGSARTQTACASARRGPAAQNRSNHGHALRPCQPALARSGAGAKPTSSAAARAAQRIDALGAPENAASRA